MLERTTTGTGLELTASSRLADELRRIGRAEGLDSVGICDADPFTETKQAIEERKREGWSAGMQFTFRNPERSTNPQATMPGARALFVGARQYRREDTRPETGVGPAARVARYSWTDHYQPLRVALGRVADRLRDDGWRAQTLVDDNALVDRAAAVRAGLGWFGKNTNVLLPGAGSWFVLGSVLTDAPIAPAKVVVVDNACGSCHKCIDDCPTGAIVEPGRLDARRCLAWLVQAPGVFPHEFRSALGDRIYGCDACQERCPVNTRAERRHPAPPAEDGSQVRIGVLSLLSADDGALEALIGRWYIPGREMRYVRRNALIVLGNTGDGSDPAVEAALVRRLGDPDPIVRSHAVWAAQRLGRADLLTAVADDSDPLVEAELELIRSGRSR
jgi:epoxyqueuosine reductase